MILSRHRRVIAVIVGLLVLFPAAGVRAEIVITLQNEFIEFYKTRVTIDTEFIVDKAHRRPNPPSKDGDLHIAGRAEEVKLPIVAEIMNARDDSEAVHAIHQAEGTGGKVKLSGAWRLWCEHGGDSEQIQGASLDPFQTTNPDHVFEIHPVTKLKNRSLLPTLKPIEGFRTKDAEDAFTKYEGIRCRIIPGEDTTSLVTVMAGYNYVEFVMELNSEPRQVEDGLMVLCKVRDLQGELLVRNRRMIMVKDSEVAQKTRGMPVGTKLHVLGLPRINLSLVSWRVRTAASGRPEVLNWGLPYEIIVVGFYEYVRDVQDDEPRPEALRLPENRRFIPRGFTPTEVERRRVAPQPPSSPMQLELPSTPPNPPQETSRRTDGGLPASSLRNPSQVSDLIEEK